MKWKNKGHEFDDVYENLRQKKKFYLFGAGRDGKLVLGVIRKLFGDRIEIAGYWDNDPQKDGTTYEGLPVTLPRACADIRGGGYRHHSQPWARRLLQDRAAAHVPRVEGSR